MQLGVRVCVWQCMHSHAHVCTHVRAHPRTHLITPVRAQTPLWAERGHDPERRCRFSERSLGCGWGLSAIAPEAVVSQGSRELAPKEPDIIMHVIAAHPMLGRKSCLRRMVAALPHNLIRRQARPTREGLLRGK